MKKLLIVIYLSIIFYILGCKVDFDVSPIKDSSLRFYIPNGWSYPIYDLSSNEFSKSKFELGKKLFYDPKLSRNNTISCGDCHQAFVAFAHSDHKLSHGVDGGFTKRNSPGLFNLAWQPTLMWDGGVNHLEVQPLAPIVNPIEMDENIISIIAKLNSDFQYKLLFKNAFGDDTINSQRILKSMAQFMALMISDDSKYDKYTRDEISLTQNELEGLNIFNTKCASCHPAPMFTDYSFRNNGLKLDPDLKDIGRMDITFDVNDSMKFKTPSLRNIALTAPYMHDGRFNTLQQVLNHYSTGIHASTTLDPMLTSGISLSSSEQLNLITFLNTLSDFTFIKNKNFKEQ